MSKDKQNFSHGEKFFDQHHSSLARPRGDFQTQIKLWSKIKGITYLVLGNIGQKLSIIYHIHLIENTAFLEDLFCKTKGLRAFQSGRIRGVAILCPKFSFSS